MSKKLTEENIRKVLEETIEPQLHMHGGGVVLRSLADGTAVLKFTGACAGCFSADQTMENVVRKTLLEEFRAAANMELYLDKDLADKGIYPAIDLQKSGTRRDDLLLSPEGKEGLRSIKALLAAASTQDALAQLMELMGKTASNEELLSRMNDWIALWEKSGFVLQR